MSKGFKSKFLSISQLRLTIKECKIDLSNDIRFNLSDQYDRATFKRANCTNVNSQMERFQCFSYKRIPQLDPANHSNGKRL